MNLIHTALSSDKDKRPSPRPSAYRRPAHVALVGLLGILAPWVASIWMGIPQPVVHDEFSYLLAADTFSQGRLTNPPHTHWQFFETMHVIGQPTYMSKYPPGQGLVMALGQVITGHPIAGVWLGVGLMCATVTWMLQAWVPTRWAVVGGLITIAQYGVLGYWAHSYWGQILVAAGAALVLGGMRRIMRRPRIGASVIMGVGVVILLITRPLEGAALCVVPAILLIWRLCNAEGRQRIEFAIKGLLPAASILALGISFTLYYNTRVTGNAFQLPYTLHAQQYESAPVFVWQQPSIPAPSNHKVLEDFHQGWALDGYLKQRSWLGLVKVRIRHGLKIWAYVAGWLLSLIMMIALYGWKNSRIRTAILITVVVAFTIAQGPWMQPHYATPLVPVLMFLVVTGIRRLTHFAGFRRTKQIIPIIVIAGVLAGKIVQTVNATSDSISDPFVLYKSYKSDIVQKLTHERGNDLVFVQYGTKHLTLLEWVYNLATIDSQEIVWARDMGPNKNVELMAYYPDRRCWILLVDDPNYPPRLSPLKRTE